jgi:predicted O-methyltransferase YrrM
VMVGDAARFLHKVAGPFDVVFDDCTRPLDQPLLDRLAALLRPGGLLITHHPHPPLANGVAVSVKVNA